MRSLPSIAIAYLLSSVSACDVAERPAIDELSSDGSIRHGAWVYQGDQTIKTLAGRNQLMTMARCYNITDIYLAIGPNRELLATQELPDFLKRLLENGVRPDALISPVPTATINEVNAIVDEVIAYNNRQTDALKRFVGVHLDIEPWGGTMGGSSWIQPLINMYGSAATRAASAGMPLVADVNGAKMADDTISTPQQRRDMFAAVRRLVLMQYDVSLTSVEQHTTSFLQDVQIGGSHDIIVAIRGQNSSWTTQIQSDLWPTPGYGGWALYEAPHLSLTGCPP